MGWRDAPLADGQQQAAPAWASAPLVGQAPAAPVAPIVPPVQPQAPITLEQRAQEVYGLEPGLDRPGGLLPIPTKDPVTGGKKWLDPSAYVAPEFLYAAAKGTLLPGHVAAGGEFQPEDVTEMAMAFGVPATRGIGKITTQIPGKITRQQIKDAPGMEELKTQASAMFRDAKGSTALIKPDSYLNALSKMENKIVSEGFDSGLHPKAAAALNAIGKRIGDDLDLQDMQIIRRHAANAAGSLDPDESRIGSIMVRQIDDYVDNLKVDDLSSGTVEGAAKNLSSARKIWGTMRKRETIDDIFAKADLQPSGFENGLRIGFRALLNNKKKIRGFSVEERKAMQDVVKGTFVSNTLKKIGKLGPGAGQQSNVVGAGIGATGGAIIGGPVGAGAVIGGGYIAQKMGERATRLAAEKARALSSGVKPPTTPGLARTQDIPRAALGAAAASQLEQAQQDEAYRLLEERGEI